VSDWVADNQRALAAELDRIAHRLEAAIAGEPVAGPGEPRTDADALERVVFAFGLTPFERDLLLLCAGAELETRIARLCGDGRPALPTFGLALGALDETHWSAITPDAPLRRWWMIEPEAGHPLTTAPLRIDERMLHHLTGAGQLDAELAPFLDRVAAPAALPASQQPAADDLAAAFGLVVLEGADAATRRAVCAAAHAPAGRAVHALAAGDLPAHPVDRAALSRRWEREAALTGAVLLLEVGDADDPLVRANATAFADALDAPLVVGAGEPPGPGRRPATHVELRRPRRAEQRELWDAALGGAAASLNGTLEQLTAHFDLGAHAIRAAAAQAGADPAGLWQACRAHARPRLGGLAQRLDPMAGWDDLVLPETEREILEEICAHVRGRAQVYDDWGFAGTSARGLGISALFEGPSGTGKTMAAEVLARQLDLDLWRIDLSQVVSKYIGETERNLRVVFDAAESGAAVLLFDEADALFGTRTEVKDSHDRYANIEVSYLLQRMEAYRGLAILTTNQKQALDTAFLRRLRFVVAFPFPDATQRERIWARAFPAATPTNGLDPAQLARLNVAGGNIRNIALGAAFLAADADGEVTMARLLAAARKEFAKLERPLSEVEVGGWR
jgi:hypothetical protein